MPNVNQERKNNMTIKFDRQVELYVEPEGDISGALVSVPQEAVLTIEPVYEDEDSMDFDVIDCTPYAGSGYLSLISRRVGNVRKSLFTELEETL